MKPHLFRKGLRSAVLRPSTQNEPCGVVRRTGARSLLVAASAATLAAVTLTFR